jgi:hypothetical protein
MNNWFTVRVKYTKQEDDGTFRRVAEPYLVAAVSFTDAEARIYEELGSVIRGEFIVTAMTRTELHDIFAYDDTDLFFKVKVTYAGNMEGEKPKKITQNFLVGASNVPEAHARIRESLASMLVDFEVPSVIKSPIVEIFPYKEELDREISRTKIAESASKLKKVLEENDATLEIVTNSSEDED